MVGLNGVIMNPVGLAALLRGADGPVYRHVIEKAELVKREAMRTAPVSTPQPGARRSRAPGTLRDSIVKRVVTSGSSFSVQVGTSDPVGLWVHEGTPAHLIQGNPLLVFYWPKAGKVVALRRVNHPGTRPHRWLVESLSVLR